VTQLDRIAFGTTGVLIFFAIMAAVIGILPIVFTLIGR